MKNNILQLIKTQNFTQTEQFLLMNLFILIQVKDNFIQFFFINYVLLFVKIMSFTFSTNIQIVIKVNTIWDFLLANSNAESFRQDLLALTCLLFSISQIRFDWKIHTDLPWPEFILDFINFITKSSQSPRCENSFHRNAIRTLVISFWFVTVFHLMRRRNKYTKYTQIAFRS